MPDTGAPWNIPYVVSSDLVKDYPTDSLALANAVATGLGAAAGFDSIAKITASDPSWPVPTLASTTVYVMVIAGGGGGGPGGDIFSAATAGGTSKFGNGAAYEISATGGAAGRGPNTAGAAGTVGFASSNGGEPGEGFTSPVARTGSPGGGGAISVGFVDLDGISTVDIIVGAGGTGATGTQNGGAGGRGEVHVYYRAG